MALRAKRKVRDPRGEWWGLYVTRTAMPRDPNLPGPYARNTKLLDDPLEMGLLAGSIVAVIKFLGRVTLKPLLRTSFLYAKGRRSGAVRIEAVALYGPRQTKYWTTTPDQVDSVLNEIAEGLEAGKTVQPAGAVYAGTREDP
jgi:hypothetical protein